MPLHSTQIHGFRPISSQHGLKEPAWQFYEFSVWTNSRRKWLKMIKRHCHRCNGPESWVLCHRNCPDNQNQLNKLWPTKSNLSPNSFVWNWTVSPIKNWSFDDRLVFPRLITHQNSELCKKMESAEQTCRWCYCEQRSSEHNAALICTVRERTEWG